MQQRARINKCDPIPEELLEGFVTEAKDTQQVTIKDLFKPNIILQRSLNMFFQWFSVTMVYYGLLFASTSLSGDPYLNFTLVLLAELPSVPMYLYLPQIFGRRNCLIVTQIMCSICCISGGLLIEVPSLSTLQIILVIVTS